MSLESTEKRTGRREGTPKITSDLGSLRVFMKENFDKSQTNPPVTVQECLLLSTFTYFPRVNPTKIFLSSLGKSP